MAKIDPHAKWLKLPAGVASFDHYELLGLDRGATQAEVLAGYQRQRGLVLPHSRGVRGEEARQLLLELNAAKTCLLDAQKRQAYDARLPPPVHSAGVSPAMPTPAELPTAGAPQLAHRHRQTMSRQGEQWLWIFGFAAAIGVVAFVVVNLRPAQDTTLADRRATPVTELPQQPAKLPAVPTPAESDLPPAVPSGPQNPPPPGDAPAEAPSPPAAPQAPESPDPVAPATPVVPRVEPAPAIPAQPAVQPQPATPVEEAPAEDPSDPAEDPDAPRPVSRIRFARKLPALRSLALLNGGQTLLTGNAQGELAELGIQWPTSTLTNGEEFLAHRGGVLSIGLSADATRAVSTGADGVVRLWKLAPLAPLRTLPGHQGPAPCGVFSPNGDFVASAGLDHTVRYAAADTGRAVQILEGDVAWTRIAFDRQGQHLACGGFDGSVWVWDLGPKPARQVLKPGAGAVQCVGYTADDQLFVARLGELPFVLNPGTGAIAGFAPAVEGRPVAAALALTGRRVLLGSDHGELGVFGAETQSSLFQLEPHAAAIGAAAFSPDGSRTISWAWDGSLQLSDLRTPFEQETAAESR